MIKYFIYFFQTPLIVLIRKAEFHLLIFAVLYLITITVIGVSSFGFPYSGDLSSPKPQRISAYVSNFNKNLEINNGGNVTK